MRTKPVPTSPKLEQVALGAARAAGRIHLRRLSRIKVTRKTNAIDLVTEADHESERAVIRTPAAPSRTTRSSPKRAVRTRGGARIDGLSIRSTVPRISPTDIRSSAYRWLSNTKTK